MYIKSNDNKIIKEVKSLYKKKYRDKLNLYLVEGSKLIKQANESEVNIKYIVVSKSYYEKNIEISDVKTYIIDDSLYKKISNLKNPEGIIGIFEKKEYNIDILLNKKTKNNGLKIIILNKLQDPGNIGTIIRTAEAAGIDFIIMENSVDLYNDKLIRASMGALFLIPIIECDSLEIYNEIKNKNIELIGTVLDSNLYYNNFDYNKDMAIIIGNEGSGIDNELLNLLDYKLTIPMAGNINSLNASVAASLVIFKSVE